MGLFNCSIEFDKSRKLWLEVALTSYDRYLCSKNRRFQVEAANCMKKADPMKATLLYDKVIQTYSEDGRFSQAGKLLKQVAEMLKEERVEDDDRILDYYMTSTKRKAENVCRTTCGNIPESTSFLASLEAYQRATVSFA